MPGKGRGCAPAYTNIYIIAYELYFLSGVPTLKKSTGPTEGYLQKKYGKYRVADPNPHKSEVMEFGSTFRLRIRIQVL